MLIPAKRNLTVFHKNASRVRQLYKNGTLSNAEAQDRKSTRLNSSH